MSKHGDPLSSSELSKVAALTGGYSCSDLTNLARDAAMGPIREIPSTRMLEVKKGDIRSVNLADFQSALTRSVMIYGMALSGNEANSHSCLQDPCQRGRHQPGPVREVEQQIWRRLLIW